MNTNEIIKFYKAYKTQIINEVQEYLDQPLKNMEKTSDTHYKVSEDNISASIRFRRNFHYMPNQYFDIDDVRDTYSLEWGWGWDVEMDAKDRNPKNFLRVLASCYKVLDDFIKNKDPEVISFSGMSKGHNALYFGDTFQKRLKTLFGEEYDIIFDREKSIIYIINKEVSNVKSESINKRSQTTSLQEATTYWKYNHMHPDTPLNVKIKAKIKKRVLEKIYF
jgi:hypothetical protein